MQTISVDPINGLRVYVDGVQVAQFDDIQQLAHLIAEASKAMRDRVNVA